MSSHGTNDSNSRRTLEESNGDEIIDDNEAQVDLLRGTEKYHHESDSEKNKHKWGVAYYKNNDYSGPQDDDINPNESLVQEVSSTAVLTPLDDDLVGEEDERDNWSGRLDFLMYLLGYSVGLGNVWRFPYLAYSNGGGAFVFPFILMLFLLGIPLMFLELAFGQFAALGPAAIFDRFCPLFTGLGYGMIAISGMVALYYTVIIGWCILYLFISFTAVLPWEDCHPDWATQYCYSYSAADACSAVNGSIYFNQTCYNATSAIEGNIHHLLNTTHAERHAPAQDYFEVEILGLSPGIEVIGNVRWKVILCLAAAWTLTFLALGKGVKSTGKVVYFTALFPYLVLCILFFRGVTLPGAMDGVLYYITPRFEKLTEAKVWSDAAAQIFFALSPAWGGLITLSSYNKFHNNCLKDSLIVSFGNICTSLFAGFVIFCIIGYLAKELDMPIDKVVDEGAGLAFVVYPDVVTRLPISPLWAILFFVMMITLGMGSEFALLETCLTAIQDTYPELRKKKVWVVLVTCIIGFCGGIIVTTQGGMFVLQLMDNYVSSWSVFIMAAGESALVGWVYGAENFLRDIQMMIGPMSRKTQIFFTIFWKYLSPLTLVSVLLFNLIQYKPLAYGNYTYPGWANGLGWVLSLIPMIIITALAIKKIYYTPSGNMSLFQKIKFLLKPSPAWGPAHKVPTFKMDEDDDEDDGVVSNPNFTITNIREISA
ncbi:sodium- and chloride-dependent glycine transporter 1-like isoform X2 [Mytilus trossulus]|uniref:sodium- and chloride-dependent glycine transporter 1-like isoform X2 n=1 Tax=Mytilus trossulus TaxID=6551 RepID=UPI003004BA8F